MQWLFVEPNDVWMFRNAKPFNAAQNFVARSIFPPMPITIQGIIRSNYLEGQGVDWRHYPENYPHLFEQVGDVSTMGELTIDGPWIGRRHERGVEQLFTFPLDLLYNDDLTTYDLMAPGEMEMQTDAPFDGWLPVVRPPNLGGGDVKAYQSRKGWITGDMLHDYIRGDVTELTQRYIHLDDIFEEEERVGLAMDRKKRAHREHHFYHAKFVRMKTAVGLLIGLNQALFQDGDWLRMGGESRSGRINLVDSPIWPEQPQAGRVKIVLQTPAYFSYGWHPQNFDWSPWVGPHGRLVSYITERAQYHSGWDLKRRRPKPTRAFVPAGSVFYFEDAQLTGRPFTETPNNEPDYSQMGFGAYISADWDYLA